MSTSSRLASLLVCAALFCAPSARAGSRAQELLQSLDPKNPAATEQTAHALAALGPGALAELFDLVTPEGQAPADAALLGAIRLLPALDVRRFLEQLPKHARELPRRRAALFLLREIGRSPDVDRALELAGAPGALDLEQDLARTLGGILARDPGAYESVARLALSTDPATAGCVVRGLAESRSNEGARALFALATLRPELALACLSNLCAVAGEIPKPIDPETLAAERSLLGNPEHAAAPELILIAGKFEDDEAVPLLIERLADEQRGLRANALWALRSITGLGLRADPRVWTAWFDEETRWWNERSTRAFNQLQRGAASESARALTELGARYWRRQRVAGEIAAFLERADPVAARMACSILGRLRCTSARAALSARLADEDETVRGAAQRALGELEGKKVPELHAALSQPPRNAASPK